VFSLPTLQPEIFATLVTFVLSYPTPKLQRQLLRVVKDVLKDTTVVKAPASSYSVLPA
jgi:hypothetical protein